MICAESGQRGRLNNSIFGLMKIYCVPSRKVKENEKERERDIRRFQNEGQREKRDITSLGALKRQAMRYYI